MHKWLTKSSRASSWPVLPCRAFHGGGSRRGGPSTSEKIHYRSEESLQLQNLKHKMMASFLPSNDAVILPRPKPSSIIAPIVRLIKATIRERNCRSPTKLAALYRLLPPNTVPRYLSRAQMARLIHIINQCPTNPIYHTLIIGIMDEFKEVNSVVSRYILRWAKYGNFQSQEEALKQVLHKFQSIENEQKTMLGIESFNFLLLSAILAQRYDVATNILKEIEKRKLLWRLTTWKAILFWSCKINEITQAVKSLETMRKQGFAVDEICVNIILNGYVKRGRISEAESLYNGWIHLVRNGPSSSQLPELAIIKPSAVSISIILNHYTQYDGNWSKVASLLKDMEEFRIPYSEGLYLALFRGFRNFGQLRGDWSIGEFYGFLKRYMLTVNQGDLVFDHLLLSVIFQVYRKLNDIEGLFAFWKNVNSLVREEPHNLNPYRLHEARSFIALYLAHNRGAEKHSVNWYLAV